MNIAATHLHQQRSLDTLRLQTEMAIEMLIALLDAIDGEADLEPYLAGFDGEATDREYDPGDNREDDPADSGIADMDGVMEQFPHLFQHCDMRVEA